jgi:hypothetical protein
VFNDVYAVSGDGFASVNPGTAGQFNAFSPNNTFSLANSNTIGMRFVLASNPATTPVQAASRGFGAIFLDVEQANSSSIEFFHDGTSLGTWFVPTSASGDPEFLGVLFNSPIVTDVRLTLGTDVLFNFNGSTVTPGGPENLALGRDLAITDDFVFAESTATPEPSAWLLFTTGGILFSTLAVRRRRMRTAQEKEVP